MIGITSYGGYVPFFRLSRDLRATAWGRGSLGGERSGANNDEDSATRAVEAAFDGLQGKDRGSVGGVFFASTTAPYREKEISSLVADGEQNVILDQVENGVAVRMALLYLVSGGEQMPEQSI